MNKRKKKERKKERKKLKRQEILLMIYIIKKLIKVENNIKKKTITDWKKLKRKEPCKERKPNECKIRKWRKVS